MKFLNNLFLPIKGITLLGDTHIMYQLLHKLYYYYCQFVINTESRNFTFKKKIH